MISPRTCNFHALFGTGVGLEAVFCNMWICNHLSICTDINLNSFNNIKNNID